MKNFLPKSIIVILLQSLILLTTSCKLIPEYIKPNPDISQNWPNTKIENLSAENKKMATEISFKEFFKNAELQKVIELALTNNRDLKIATLNIESAQEFYRIQKADLFPSISAGFKFSRQRTPPNALGRFGGTLSAGRGAFIVNNYEANLVSAAFELDLFGRVRSVNKSAFEDFLAKIETRNVLKISLIAQTANTYLQWIADLEKIKIADENLTIEEKYFDLVTKIYEEGIISRIDLMRARTALEAAKSTRANLIKIAEQDKNILVLLTAQKDDSKIEKIKLSDIKLIEDLPINLPSEVLLLRPDIAQAEHNLKAQNANIGAARASFFPSISITGNYGYASNKFSNLFERGSKSAWNYAPQINIPIFEGAKNFANLRGIKVEKQIAIENYQKAIQTAFKEVADELVNKKSIKEELESYRLVTNSYQEIFTLYQELVKQGSRNNLDLITSQRDLLIAKNNEIDVYRRYLTNQINLYKVLGGGLAE